MLSIDLIATLAGMIIPPAYDFIKKKFVKESNDTPERTMGSLATTKPEVLPAYIAALSTFYESQVKFFNRDIAGTPSQWIIDLRSAIRPLVVVASVVVFAGSWAFGVELHEGIRLPLASYVGAWMTSRNL